MFILDFSGAVIIFILYFFPDISFDYYISFLNVYNFNKRINFKVLYYL